MKRKLSLLVIEESAPDMYTYICEQNDISTYRAEEPKLFSGAPFEYAINSGDNMISNSGEVKTEQEFQQYANEIPSQPTTRNSSPDYDIFVDSLPSGYRRIRENNLDEFIGANQVDYESSTYSYACVPVALSIIARLAFIEFDMIESYEQLWNYTSTKLHELENGISYGVTNYNDGGRGFCNYVREQFGINATWINVIHPMYSRLCNRIDAKELCMFVYGLPNGNIGHAIVPEGYIIMQNSQNLQNFLLIADGWYDHPRYLNYKTSIFDYYNAIEFSGI